MARAFRMPIPEWAAAWIDNVAANVYEWEANAAEAPKRRTESAVSEIFGFTSRAKPSPGGDPRIRTFPDRVPPRRRLDRSAIARDVAVLRRRFPRRAKTMVDGEVAQRHGCTPASVRLAWRDHGANVVVDENPIPRRSNSILSIIDATTLWLDVLTTPTSSAQ